MPEICGLFHVHSKYSYDGHLSLGELKELAKKEGWQFIVLTEHTKDMTKDEMEELIRECELLSDEKFTIIPGLELDCGSGMHLLGIGIKKYIENRSLKDAIWQIHDSGGLAILAHPPSNAGLFQMSLVELDGVELWNTVYDSSWIPRLSSFQLLEKLRTKRESVYGYGGVDFHRRGQLIKLLTIVDVEKVNCETILDSFKKGKFYLKKGNLIIDPSGDLGSLQKFTFAVLGPICLSPMKIYIRLSRFLRLFKIEIPQTIKGWFRHIF